MTNDLRSTLALLKDRIAARDRAGINRAANALIDQQAPLGAQYATIATLLQHHGEHDAALRALDAWRDTAGDQPNIAFARATTLARAGRVADAQSEIDRLPASFPDAVSNAYLKGTLATDMGNREVAVRELARAVALAPASGQSWLARAMVGPLDPAEADDLHSAGSNFEGVETADSAAYLYAVGKFLDDHGDHDGAFAAISRGALTMQRLKPFDATADAALADAEIASWSAAAIADVRKEISPGAAPPIFVTGLPRSGTTLVEQILVSNSRVAGGAEMSLMPIIGRDIGGLSHRAFAGWRARGGNPQALRDLYDHLARQRFAGAGRIVDKTLATSRHMGLIAALFPDAPIIWLRRDPIDCAWSVFRSYFVKGVEWGWSLASIADFFTQEDRLFEHFVETLGDQLLVVPFDQLVRDPEHWTKAITDHAGLRLEPAQLTPHRTERAVSTNSASQVREEIHQRGIGSAEPYRRRLDEFSRRYASPPVIDR